jgi:ABC-type uncharacterized transport system involved in gliding motility auxiliary subunit
LPVYHEYRDPFTSQLILTDFFFLSERFFHNMSAESKTNKNAWLFSAVGALILAAILILMNIAAAKTNAKVDLTEYKLHTLSQGSRNIVGRLDTPVEIRFYASRDKNAMPQVLRDYADSVLALLTEYQEKAPKDMITLEVFNPEPDTDDEDSARLNGISAQSVGNGTQIYLGLSVTQLDKKVSMPFLDPSRDELLEYDMSRAITEVSKTKKPVIGVMTGLPIAGTPQLPPQMQAQMQQRPQPAWYIYNELQRDYDVRDLSLTSTKEIPAEVNVLLVVHPNGISDEAEFAIDQFLLKGGSVLAFLDPFSIYSAQSGGGNPMMPTPGQSSDLKKLLPAWGFEFETAKVIADNKYRTPMTRTENNPSVLTIDNTGIAEDDIVTNQIRDLLFLFSGVFYGEPKEGISQDILVKSSDQAGTVNPQAVQQDPSRLSIDVTGKEYVLAMRLSGRFKTAFPEGAPLSKEEEAAKGSETEDDKEKDKEEEKKVDNSIKDSEKDGVVILVADSDILYDQWSLSSNPMFPQFVSYRNGNIPLVQGMIEQLSGDTDLISVRSRGSVNRPFTLINKMRSEAENKQRQTIKDLEAKRDDAQGKLSELQNQKSTDQQYIASPEQREEIEKYNKLQAETSKKLRDVRKELNKDVTSIENEIRVQNIVIVPLLIIILGVVHAVRRRRRTTAR